MSDLLRQTITELTDETPPTSPNLARTAIAVSRRTHRRRLTAACAAVAVLAIAIAVPFALKPHGDSGPTTQRPPNTTEQPKLLAGGWLVNTAGPLFLDREHGSYVRRTDSGAVRALVGDRVLLPGTASGFRITTVGGGPAITADSGQFRGDLQWSPTGDRLVGMIDRKGLTQLGFGIIDAATGKVTKHWIDRKAYDCSECTFGWTRDGRETVLAIADRSGGESAELVARLQLFDAATGRPTRSLPVKGLPISPFSWSPDGRSVIVDAEPARGRLQLVDVATGTPKPFAYNASWVTDDLLLAPDNGTVVTLRPDGSVVSTWKLDGAIARQDTGVTLGPPN